MIYNSTKILSNEISLIRYTNLSVPDELTEQSGREESNQGLLKLSASFKPNFNNQIDYDILARISNDVQKQNLNNSHRVTQIIKTLTQTSKDQRKHGILHKRRKAHLGRSLFVVVFSVVYIYD